jgi:hypothetical protein
VSPVLVLNGEDADNFTVTEVDGSWAISPALLTVTPHPQTAQYSDNTPDLTFSYSGFAPGDDGDDIDTAPACVTNRLVGDYARTDRLIGCGGGEDDNYDFTYVRSPFTVTKEDATVLFGDNESAVQVTTAGGGYTGPLSFTIMAKEKQPDSPAALAAAGDIAKSGLTAKLEPSFGTGTTVVLDCGSPTASGMGYSKVLTYTCTADVTDLPVNTYDLVADVTGDYYVGDSADMFTVYDPSLGFATGGGWFRLDGDKVNFGFVMKYTKKATNVKGSFVAIRHHADGTISRIKSNQLGGLAIQDSNGCGIATFNGKSTYRTWDPVANEYINKGGEAFAVYAKDCNEPGTGHDSIQVRGPGVFGMNSPVVISGGNIAVPHKAPRL